MPRKIYSNLLLVEDDKLNRMLMGQYLEGEDHQVTFAVNGREALELLVKQPFDMVLLDIEMPEMNGYQVLNHVMADPKLRDIPIIVTSGVDQLESVVRCIEMGAEDYLTKPVNRVLLKARIDASLEKKHLRDIQKATLQRLEREMEIARNTQMSILPEKLPNPIGYEFGALMIPARAVGGDFYDVIPMQNERWGILIGDVTDKGLPAALYMTLTYSLLRSEASRETAPDQALINVNHYLLGMNAANMFVTVLCGILDTKSHKFDYARAGHLAPVIVDSKGNMRSAALQQSQPIGIFDNLMIDRGSISIPKNGTLLFFSDGVSEAVNEQDEQFDEKRLGLVLRECSALNPTEICNKLWQEVQDHGGSVLQQDDFTVLAIRHK